MSQSARWAVGGGIALLLLLAMGGIFYYGLGYGWWAGHNGPGEITKSAIPADIVSTRAKQNIAAAAALGEDSPKQILFGDWHVHTTYSVDAFMGSLPHVQGEGAHPPADACDFARYCSAIDFWALTDHSEQITPREWQESVDTVRQCNAVAADEKNPDTVAFLGWEWTQVGFTRDTHYGHKNVVFKGINDGEIAPRPITAGGIVIQEDVILPKPKDLRMTFLAARDPEYLRLGRFVSEARAIKNCPDNVKSTDLPSDCREVADTPEVLFRKLDELGMKSVVIPHGTTWGYYTPPGSDWRKQLTSQMHDPKRQTLVEIYSGHGNSEEYRSWRDVVVAADGSVSCPEPSANYLPACWRAGEIIQERCKQANLGEAECEKRAAQARQMYADVTGVGGHNTIPGGTGSDWLDAGQCKDCFLPAFTTRPLSSVQYMMAIRNFDPAGKAMRFDFGFIASSDVHTARPGTGYKEFARLDFTETGARAVGPLARLRMAPPSEKLPQSVAYDAQTTTLPAFARLENERSSSYMMTGGLMAVHASGRDRNAIWDAVEAKETYATSGPRILLWFDLVNGSDGAATVKKPMGSHVVMTKAPEFRISAVGSYKQKPGCPDYSTKALTAERLASICHNECYNPSDERMLITRLEVVRIQPQNSSDEDLAKLIQDPWKTFQCPPSQAGCTATFSDPEFVSGKRDTVYYVRAIQEPSLAVNGDKGKCKKVGADGRCLEVDMCGWDKANDDDCLGMAEERAWSSPILVDAAG